MCVCVCVREREKEREREITGYEPFDHHACMAYTGAEFIDDKTSMITDEDPLRGLLFC